MAQDATRCSFSLQLPCSAPCCCSRLLARAVPACYGRQVSIKLRRNLLHLGNAEEHDAVSLPLANLCLKFFFVEPTPGECSDLSRNGNNATRAERPVLELCKQESVTRISISVWWEVCSLDSPLVECQAVFGPMQNQNKMGLCLEALEKEDAWCQLGCPFRFHCQWWEWLRGRTAKEVSKYRNSTSRKLHTLVVNHFEEKTRWSCRKSQKPIT